MNKLIQHSRTVKCVYCLSHEPRLACVEDILGLIYEEKVQIYHLVEAAGRDMAGAFP